MLNGAVLPSEGARQDGARLFVDSMFDMVAEPVYFMLGTGVLPRRSNVLQGTQAKDVAL